MSHAPESKKGSDVVKVGFYQIIKTIGQGHSAIVKLANHTITKTNVAIKIIDKRQKDSNLEKIYREIKILKALKHPNIIKLYQVMDSENFLYIVSEYAPNGEIFDYISNHGRFPEKEAKLKFAQILNAVEYCHNLGIVHRDLKAENLLLDENFNVKLADFGFGNFYSKDSVLSTWCGSPPYAAPEIFEGKTYCGPEVDIWSLGVILYVLVVGMLPFDGENLRAIRDKVVTGRFRIPFFMSIECEQVLRRILVVDPKRRYTIQQIKQHQWMREAVVALSDKNLEDSFSEQLVVTGRGVAALCHKVVLRRMENSNINKEKVIESLEKQTYDNFTAIYEILMKQMAHKMMKQTLPIKLSASGFRRPSVISEQAMVAMQHHQVGISAQQSVTSPLSPTEAKTPGLAETRKAPFSQTTDGVQLNEVAGPICQMQQIISTIDESSDETRGLSGADAAAAASMAGGGVLVMPSSPLRPKLTRSSRLMLSPGICWTKLPGSKAMLPNQLAGNSIDEGVEIEGDEVLTVSTTSAAQPTETSFTDATTTQPSETAFSASLTPPYFQASCQPSISIDSNIEIDAAGSNLSLSSSQASWSVNSTSSNLPDIASGGTQSTIQSAAAGECNEQSQFSHNQIPEDLMNFQMGRRASDGLAIKHETAETQQFLKNRVSGVAELRKELVRLQNETMEGCQASQLPLVMASSGGHKSRAILKDHKSFEEALAVKSSMGIKYTSNLAPNFCWVMQKRNPPYSRQSHLQSPMESIQGGFRTDYTCLGAAHRPISPLRGNPKRQVGPMRSVPLHHQIHSNYAMVSGHQFFAEHLASASNSPTRGGKIFSLAPVCLASSSSPGDVNQISSFPYSPVATMSSLGVPQNYVPVCHSQGNLVQNVLFGSPTRHRLETPTSSSSSPLHQSKTSAATDAVRCSYYHHQSVGLRQMQDCSETRVQSQLPPSVEEAESDSFPCDPGSEDLEKPHLFRRMMFSLNQQQQVCGSEEEMVTSPVKPHLDANH